MAVTTASADPDWYYLHPDSLFAPWRKDETVRLPTNKLFYLEQKHGLCPSQRRTDEPESLYVRMVGKWGGGPSWGVTGRDTLVFLSRGSEVVVINFADTANPEILNHIQAKRLAGRPVLQDSLLYLATSGYIEVFDVSDPTNAPRIGRLSVPVADIDVEDSLVDVIGADSFMVWSFADPGSPYMLGACRDSGTAVDVENGYAYLCDRWGLYVLDVRDPANPHRVASWGSHVDAVRVRGNHCYVATGSTGGNSLFILNVSDPSSPWQEGVLAGITGLDVRLVDSLLFLPGFDVVNVADSSRPTLVAQTPVGGPKRGVWVDGAVTWGFAAADYAGLHLLTLADIENPQLDTTVLGVGEAEDISVAGDLACAACFRSDAVFFDVGEPTRPAEVGRYRGRGYMESVLTTESLAYVDGHTQDSVLLVLDVTDPADPVLVGAEGGWEPPEAMVLRDSFLYAAEPYRFEVFSVADPRQPVWRGRCNLQEAASDVVVRGTLAYVTSLPSAVVDISDPANPAVIGTISTSAYGIAVYDTFAYLAVNYGGLKIWSIADPTRPYRIDTIAYERGYEVEVAESLLLYGGLDFRVLDLATPALPLEVGSYETPYRTRKVDWDGQYVYAACFMAGVCVLEYLPTGLSEGGRQSVRPWHLGLHPNPTRGRVQLNRHIAGDAAIRVYDASGRKVAVEGTRRQTEGRGELDLFRLPAGLYFLEFREGGRATVGRVIKQ